jgi:hypothetical protein
MITLPGELVRQLSVLYKLLSSLSLAQSHTRAAAVLVDELDAGSFKSLPYNF